MQSGEQAPEPATLSGAAAPAAAAPEPTIVGEAAAERPANGSAAEAPSQVQETEASAAPVDGGGVNKSPIPSPSAAPASPSTVKERQIPVDPASLRRLGMVADEDSPLSAPSVLTEVMARSSSSPLMPPLRRPTFVGASLPCSSASSPVHGAGAGAKWEEQDQQPAAATHSPTSALRSLARQHSAALARLVAATPSALSRSASRAEGRTMAPHDDETPDGDHKMIAAEDGFTCGALCMFIPGFSRKKPATAFAAAGTAVSSMQRQPSGLRPRRSSASRVASLERFECGSWSPPPPPEPVAAPHDAADCLAMEVAKTSCAADEAEAPVKMAFVFDGEPPSASGTTRGILKNSSSVRLDSARPSTSSQRHVRFSTAVAADVAASCPTSPCITPRLARARAEFNAFLEAQST